MKTQGNALEYAWENTQGMAWGGGGLTRESMGVGIGDHTSERIGKTCTGSRKAGEQGNTLSLSVTNAGEHKGQGMHRGRQEGLFERARKLGEPVVITESTGNVRGEV